METIKLPRFQYGSMRVGTQVLKYECDILITVILAPQDYEETFLNVADFL